MTADTPTMTTSDLAPRLYRGALAGLAGGLVFGLVMSMMDMIGMIGGLVGQMGNVPVSWLLHLVISSIVGAIFAVAVPWFDGSSGRLLGGGLVYGLVWWFLGPLLLMPTVLGMGPQLSSAGMRDAVPSLVGHLIFGAVTALAWAWLERRG